MENVPARHFPLLNSLSSELAYGSAQVPEQVRSVLARALSSVQRYRSPRTFYASFSSTPTPRPSNVTSAMHSSRLSLRTPTLLQWTPHRQGHLPPAPARELPGEIDARHRPALLDPADLRLGDAEQSGNRALGTCPAPQLDQFAARHSGHTMCIALRRAQEKNA